VTASIGGYDAMATGLVAAAVLASVRLAARPRAGTALLLAAVLGAGGLTKPTVWVAVLVAPFALLLADLRSPGARRRVARAGAHLAAAAALGYAVASIARISPLYDQPIATPNQRSLGDALGQLGPILREQASPLWDGLAGYLTLPGVALAVAGVVVGARRNRPAAALLGAWTLAVLASALLLPLTEYPRYVATAMVPLSAFAALGAVAAWDALVRGSWAGRGVRIAVAVAAAALALAPAARFELSVLTDPETAAYPGLDRVQYVTATSAQIWLDPVAEEIERAGGPYPVRIDVGPNGYPWGLDLRLNGADVGGSRRYDVYANATPQLHARARWLVRDGIGGPHAPAGFRLVRTIARPDGGAVMRLYERR
jgi:hypothetical protein